MRVIVGYDTVREIIVTHVKLILSFGGKETWEEWWTFEEVTFKLVQRMTDHPKGMGMCVHRCVPMYTHACLCVCIVFRENRMAWLLRPMAQHEESFLN